MLFVPIEVDADSQANVNQLFDGHRDSVVIERRLGDEPVVVIVARGPGATAVLSRLYAEQPEYGGAPS